jgi:hypothetical protein
LPSPSPSSATTRSARGPWTPTLILAALALLWLCASGCGKTVLVNRGSPVRIAEPVYVFQLEGGEWVRSANRVDVRGWYAVSPEEVE